jgi:hypothetical protein
MAEDRYAVDYETLRFASRDSREAANGLSDKVKQHLTGCAAAGDHHQGWDTATALNECVEAWAAHLNGHVEHAHAVGKFFHETHANYVNADYASDGDHGTQEV